MKRFLLILITLLIIASPVSANYFPDITVTSTDGIWTDTRAFTTINAAATAIGAVDKRTIVIPNAQVVTALTITSNITLKFERDGSIANSGQLTIQTPNIIADDHQIFTGAGDIDFVAGSVVRSTWFSDIDEALDVTNDDTLTMIIAQTETTTADLAVGNNVTLKWDSPFILTVAGAHTLSNVKNIEAGNYIILAGAGDIDFLDGSELKLNWFLNLNTILTWIEAEEVTIIINEDSVVSLTVASAENINYRISKGGYLNIDNGVVLTVLGYIDAGNYQYKSGLGTLVYGGGSGININYSNCPDFNEVDQGATGDGYSVKAYVDIIGADDATIVFRHNSGAATTTYTFSTDETIPSNINVIVEKGAIISGIGKVSLGDGSVKEAYPQWWGFSASASAATNTTALNAALAAYSRVFIPKGTYSINEITMNLNNVLYGNNMQDTILDYGGAGVAITADGSPAGLGWRSKIEDIKVTTSTGTNGIRIKDLYNFELNRVWVRGFSSNGVNLNASGGLYVISARILNSTIEENPGDGLVLDGVGSINHTVIKNCRIRGNGGGGTGYNIYASVTTAIDDLLIEGNDLEAWGATNNAVYINSGRNIKLTGNYYENSTAVAPAIYLGGTGTIEGASIINENIFVIASTEVSIQLGTGTAAGTRVTGVNIFGCFFNADFGINPVNVKDGNFGPNLYEEAHVKESGSTSSGIVIHDGTVGKNQTNLLSNSGFSVWSNATLENVRALPDATSTVIGTTVSSDAHLLTKGMLVKDAAGTPFVFEVLTVAANSFTVDRAGGTDGQWYEVTPGCVAADALTFDGGYAKTVSAQIYREHRGTNTKDGSFYSLQFSTTAINQGIHLTITELNTLGQLAGKTVTFGCWIKADEASNARIYLNDSVAAGQYSASHTGGGDWEWIEITRTFASASTYVQVAFRAELASKTCYYSQPMLILGSYIGKGNYVAPPSEWIDLEAAIILTDYSNVALADAAINLEAQSKGKISKGVKAVYANVTGTGAAITDKVDLYESASKAINGVRVNLPVAANPESATGRQKCDANGDVYIDETGTVTACTLKIIGCQLN